MTNISYTCSMKQFIITALLLLVVPLQSSSPLWSQAMIAQDVTAEVYNTRGVENWLKESTFTNKDRPEIQERAFGLFYSIIKDYAEEYALDDTTLTLVVMSIAQSEGSNGLGHPYMSTLYKDRNNPFGIKGGNNPVTTVEYYNGKRTVIKDSFMYFESLQDAIKYKMDMLSTKNRYKRLKTCTTPLSFFKMMGRCGYYTHPTWYNVFNHLYNFTNPFDESKCQAQTAKQR